MRPLVLALTAGPDLVTQGLRTLELCIDNLTQEFLDPIIQPILHELMQALWSHLRPLPHNHHHSHSALRILGKLGGRNRKFLDQGSDFDVLDIQRQSQPKFKLCFHGAELESSYSWTDFVPLANRVLRDSTNNDEYKHSAFHIVRAALMLFFDAGDGDSFSGSEYRALAQRAVQIEETLTDLPHEMVLASHPVRSRNSHQLAANEALFVEVCDGLFSASKSKLLKDSTTSLLLDICQYLVLSSLLDWQAGTIERQAKFVIDGGQHSVHIQSNLMLDIIIDALSSDEEESIKLAKLCIDRMWKTSVSLLGNAGKVHRLPLFGTFLRKCCHACYELSWQRKVAGTIGIETLMTMIGPDQLWSQENQGEVVKALLYVIKDMPQEISIHCVADATELLTKLISQGLSTEDYTCATTAISVLVTELANPNNQIGHIDAISFCMALEPAFLDFNEELLRLLHEALALADADDDAFVNVSKTSQYKSASSLVSLRIVCIKLLTIAVASPEFSTTSQAQSRSRIISVFFKSLYSKSADVVEVANIGLKQVLNQNHKLPKDLLQAGLRPILMNLSDHKRLTVPGLEGLARLLELLTNYFKVEIGKKLLDHLKAWADPATLQSMSGKALAQQQSIKVIAAILNIFHLLPSSAHMFLEELILSVLGLEEQLRRTLFSPLRPPLQLFVNKYPKESWEYLRRQLGDSKIASFLLQLADHDLSHPVRQAIADGMSAVISAHVQTDMADGVRSASIIEAFAVLSKHDTSALTSSTLQDLRILHSRWIPKETQRSSRYVEDVICVHLRYFESQPEDLAPFFSLCNAQAAGQFQDDKLLERYIENDIVTNTSVEYKRRVLLRAMEVFTSEDSSQAYKIFLFRMLINPVLLWEKAIPLQASVVDSAFVTHANHNIWQIALTDYGHDKICPSDLLRIELLQFSTLVLRDHVELVSEVRKEVIKFAWNYIKCEDVYYALLCSSQPEARGLVKQALDILAPVLPDRIPAGHDAKTPSWITYSRKVIAEESNVQQLIPLYSFICRQATLFTPCREYFLGPILLALPKLGFPQNANTESRILTVELLELVLSWSMMPATQAGRAGRPVSNVGLPDIQFEALISFCLRFACTPLEASKKGLIARINSVISGLLKERPVEFTRLPISILEPYIGDPEEKTQSLTINALDALAAVLVDQTPAALFPQMNKLVTWIEKLAKSDQMIMQEKMLPLFIAVTKSLPDQSSGDEETESIKSYHNRIMNVIHDSLQMGTHLAHSVAMIKALSDRGLDINDSLIPPMVKAFNASIKEHLNRAFASTTTLPATGQETIGTAVISSTDDGVDVLIGLMRLISARMLSLGDQRRTFLAAIVQLIEKSPSSKVCRSVLELVSDLVIEKKEIFPTVKEKVSLLLKMTMFDGRGDDSLLDGFLRLIIAIYKDPSTARTELTVRLEQAFLMGTRASNVQIREEFMALFNGSMSRSLYTRLNYIFGVQNWESLSSHYWIYQANHLLLGSVVQQKMESPRVGRPYQLRTLPPQTSSSTANSAHDSDLEALVRQTRINIRKLHADARGSVLPSLAVLQHLDVKCGAQLWEQLMAAAWSALQKKDRHEIAKAMTIQLSKECHLRQVEKRPNVIQTLLRGISHCEPLVALPPHLIKYLGKSFDAWYIAIDLLERSVSHLRLTDPFSGLYDSSLDALTELYAALAEDDMFYGLWRARCRYVESNAAISYEQNGMWDKAQQLYETAQVKARTGVLPFSESEYTLWEDHWILCAQKLQQWDVLTDLAKQEGYSDLCSNVPGAFQIGRPIEILSRLPSSHSWISLHLEDIPSKPFWRYRRRRPKQKLCRSFNEFVTKYVELQEAGQIYASLASTQAQNLEAKSHELKHILQTWRERLPNFYDDINGWSDLVAWRQLIFSSINRVYLPLVSGLQQPSAPNSNSSATSFAYRGYHETAWIINRFAHVARKHDLPDVCISQLTKIYTLPNIEIQEAFLKLREQAKCHYQNPAELGMGLEVISNTNLMYFGTQQKAEFFTLKGMFLAKLKLNEDANQAFATAIQIDLTLPKAWAEWGQYSDRLFQEDSTELTKAGNAVSCYLQAAGLYKNGRARSMLSRVLWLLSLDDTEGTIASAFDSYKGEVPTWYWVTFIPQLLTSLSHKEARHARQVLIRIAKTFPQSLHFQLRTTKEDYAVIKKQALAAAQNASASVTAKISADANGAVATSKIGVQASRKAESAISTSSERGGRTDDQSERTDSGTTQIESASPEKAVEQPVSASTTQTGSTPAQQLQQMQNSQSRQPWEHVDEIMAILKTAYPLLALSMESMVDQIQQKFKCQADEDAYRLIVALLNDGVQYIGRLVTVSAETKLPPATQANVTRFADSVLPKNIKAAFEREFVLEKPNLQEYVAKLRKWRDKFELILDQRDQIQQLEQVSPYLSEFHYQKFDEVEIPGQYLQHRDNNSDFIRIDRFMPTLDVVRGHGICYRRVTMRGHDGSHHQFAIQYPAARHCRREERITQLFRILSGVLARRKESRRRGLHFHLPAAIPLAPHIRIVQDDSSYISLQGIYEDYCNKAGQHKDEPLRLANTRIQQAQTVINNNKQNLITLKVEILDVIQRTLVPEQVVLNFFQETFGSFAGFWCFRKQFSQQYASLTFMTYVMNINNRFPHKLFISRKSGYVWGTEILPGMAPNNPVFHNGEAVPFRLTPSIQSLMGPVSTEGVFTPALMTIARCLSEPEFELDQQLSVFVRDELITWFTQQHRPVTQETQLPEKVSSNVAQIVRRACSLSQVAHGNLPAYQTIIDLISQAVNPRNLAQMDQLWSVCDPVVGKC
ncbi:hypothetical protein MRB53_041886 [Persea americana]|nr:hypothetical protein MRB53_041886 [Persea americana]